jgi:hypothetical protein
MNFSSVSAKPSKFVFRSKPTIVKRNLKKIKNTLLRLQKIELTDIIKQLSNGHALIVSKAFTAGRWGNCTECLEKNVPASALQKLSSFCPACEGCSWICEGCFDEVHMLQ